MSNCIQVQTIAQKEALTDKKISHINVSGVLDPSKQIKLSVHVAGVTKADSLDEPQLATRSTQTAVSVLRSLTIVGDIVQNCSLKTKNNQRVLNEFQADRERTQSRRQYCKSNLD